VSCTIAAEAAVAATNRKSPALPCEKLTQPGSAELYGPGMRRVVLDSNAVDPIADTPGAYEAMRAAVDSGHLELLYTHVNINELTRVPDEHRRAQLVLILVALGRLVPTGSTAVDFSRLDFCRVGDDTDVLDALRSGNVDHTRDALIASTAVFEKCALVTNEHRLTKRSRERGIEVLSSSELLQELTCASEAAAGSLTAYQ
jgi:rRNA-processing protein FCF1